MRILYSHYLTEDAHPAALMVAAIAGELREIGHQVIIHRSAGPPEPRPRPRSGAGGGKGRMRASRRLRDALWFARALGRNRAMLRRDLAAIASARPDVVLARQDAYCVSMPRAASRRGVPLVTYADAPVAYETRLSARGRGGRWHPPGLVEAMERWTLRRSRAVVTVSGPAARRLGRYGLKTPIFAVPNGVDPSRFPATSTETRTARRRALGLSAPRIAGFVGSFRPFHGIDRLVELIRSTEGRADTQWLLVGDGPERPALEEAIGDRPDVVSLGHRPAEEVGRLLGLMDLAVAPHPRIDGDFYFCPLKVLEAAAAGCAVVASDQGDIPDLLDWGRAGVIVSEDRPEAWIAAVLGLLDDPSRCKALGDAARGRVLGQFTWRDTAEAVAGVLEGAIEPETARSAVPGGIGRR